MSDQPPIVLSYANPIGSQPANGRLIIEPTETGITVTDTKTETSISPAAARWIGISLLTVGSVFTLLVLQVKLLLETKSIAGILAAAIGAVLIIFPGSKQPQSRIVQIESGKMYFVRGRRKRVLRGRCQISFADLNLSSGQRTHSLVCRHWLLGTQILFKDLHPDEAIWAKSEIERAMEK